MTKLYFDILDFVFNAKIFEFYILEKHSYEGPSIFRGVIDKKIEPKGEIITDSVNFKYKFHGLGIDIYTASKIYKYNHYSGEHGLGVYFTPNSICDLGYEITNEILNEFIKLENYNLIKQWMPEIPMSKVYYLV